MDVKTLANTVPWQWPEDAGALLLGVLKDRQAAESDRTIAATLAGDIVVMSDEMAKVLLSIVEDPGESDGIRGRAAISLGPVLEHAETVGFDDFDDIVIGRGMFKRVQKTLQAVFENRSVPDEVRRPVLEGSVRAPLDWHTPAVRHAYTSDDPAWKRTAVFCMAYVAGFEDEILESLESADPEIRLMAVDAAGNWGIDEAWPLVAPLLSSARGDKDLLISAIEAVSSIRPEEALELLPRFVDDPDEEISEAAADALTMARGELGQPGDEEQFDEDDEPDDED